MIGRRILRNPISQQKGFFLKKSYYIFPLVINFCFNFVFFLKKKGFLNFNFAFQIKHKFDSMLLLQNKQMSIEILFHRV